MELFKVSSLDIYFLAYSYVILFFFIPDIDLVSYINDNTPQTTDKDIINIIKKLKYEPHILLDYLTDNQTRANSEIYYQFLCATLV